MLTSADAVFDAALALPSDLRVKLAKQLWESVEESDEPVKLSPEWIAEIERRLKEVDEGKVQCIPSDEVFAALRKRQ